MADTTAWVREALQDLGPDAPDAAVKAYIRENAPSVPQSQIGFALRKLRGRVILASEKDSPPEAENA